MPTKNEWACPRCQTSPCTGDTCETCGAAKDWRRPAKKPLETPQEAAKREARKQAEADEEAKLQARNAKKIADDAKSQEELVAQEERIKREKLLTKNRDILDVINAALDARGLAKQTI